MGSLVSLYRLGMSSVAKKGKVFGAPDSNKGDNESLEGPCGPPIISFPSLYIGLAK